MNKTKSVLARVAFMISVFLLIVIVPGTMLRPTGPTGHELAADPGNLIVGAAIALLAWASFMAMYMTRDRGQR